MPDRIPAHGAASRYQGPRRHNRWAPCRCDLCRAAWRRDCKIRDLRRLRGAAAYVDRAVVVAHINRLIASGWSQTAIYTTAGVARRTLWSWLNGTVEGVQHSAAARVLALRPVSRTPDLVPAIGTARRLQALAAMGWPVTRSGIEAGISDTHARNLARGRRQQVTKEVAQKVDVYYRQRCMRPGPSACAKTVALRNGWVTAVAWDDIDDPNDIPHISPSYRRPKHLASAA
ncbi:hypothetical protein [Streptomyces sp. NPDC002889]|uniref:hypothetical protein n=1 Tax=Streptomyces sp. NPDC002889 TaxID=3364669 RepID=UPI0036956222